MSDRREYNRIYMRGYNARRFNEWPEDKPPRPPDEHVGALVEALRAVCAAADEHLGTLDTVGDEIAQRLYDAVETGRDALAALTQWCREEQR